MFSAIWHFITHNLPSPGAIFYSTVLGAITIVVLAFWRRMVDRASRRFVSDESIDKILTRLERNAIIKTHHSGRHEKTLKHCAEGHCSKLSPVTKGDPLSLVVAAEAGLDLHH
jgi:hypothetical protein